MNKRSSDDSKKKILLAARSVFTEGGYAQASMRAVAREAEISVGGLYLYFKNKEELYLAMMQEAMNELNDQALRAVCTIDDPVAAIRAFIAMNLDFASSRWDSILLQGKELGFSCVSEFRRRFSGERRGIIENIIRTGVACGVFRECDVPQTAKVIFNMLRGFSASMALDEESLFTPEEGADLVLNGLLRRNDR